MERVHDSQYRPYVLKEYEYWTLLLNENQRYLGRAVAWLARAGEMQKFSGLWAGELVELQHIAQEYEAALEQLGWKPDHMNYAMLGNDFHLHAGHGHMHFFPRYKEPREFMHVTFVDDRWGKNYAPATPFELHKEVLASIVAVLQDELERKTA